MTPRASAILLEDAALKYHDELEPADNAPEEPVETPKPEVPEVLYYRKPDDWDMGKSENCIVAASPNWELGSTPINISLFQLL